MTPLTPTQIEAARLILSGYARISNSGRLVARMDTPDWKNVSRCEDLVRCVHSKDRLKVSKGVYALMPASGHYNIGYREVVPPFTPLPVESLVPL